MREDAMKKILVIGLALAFLMSFSGMAMAIIIMNGSGCCGCGGSCSTGYACPAGGYSNWAHQFQFGISNTAKITQHGYKNWAEQYQFWRANKAVIRQRGQNSAFQYQWGKKIGPLLNSTDITTGEKEV